jgi:hypothetical protein
MAAASMQVMGLWLIMGMALGLSTVLTITARVQWLLHSQRRRGGGVAPIEQQQGSTMQQVQDAYGDDDSAAAIMKAKIAAGYGQGGLAGISEETTSSIGAYRSDAVAKISVAAANAAAGKIVSSGAAGSRTSNMQQQQQQVPRLPAHLLSPTKQGPGHAADVAAAAAAANAARGQRFTPRNADGTAVLTARQVELQHAELPGVAQQQDVDDEADRVLML